MKTFIYSRTFTNDKWNINNINDTDSNGISVTLATRISAAFPANPSKVILDNQLATVIFNTDLTSEEETTLNTVVSDHESANNSINPSTHINLVSSNGTNYIVSVSNLGILIITPS